MKNLDFKGDKMPAIGLGTWKSAPNVVGNAIEIALNNGYRHIDCAATYANESEIGRAFNTVFSEGKVKRDEVWITSKLWNNAHRPEDVIPALKKTLADLQLDALDLYLIHWPVAFRSGLEGFPQSDQDYLSLEEIPLIDTWEAMLEAKRQGLVKHVGVSNFSIKKLKDLATKTNEMPEVNQIELHPYLQQTEMLDFCKTHNIHLTAFSPLGSGDRIPSMKGPDEPSLLENKTILSIAKKHDVSPAQVIINWSVSRGTAVIPKSTNASRIKENLDSLKFTLDETDLQEIGKLDKHFRYVTGEFFITEGNSYENVYDD